MLALFDVLDLWFNDPKFGGCLFINTAAEFPNPHDPIHQAAAALVQALGLALLLNPSSLPDLTRLPSRPSHTDPTQR